MSADTSSETKPASKPLIALIDSSPAASDDAKPSAAQCCGGGSCSL